jgi:hypothetical protein
LNAACTASRCAREFCARLMAFGLLLGLICVPVRAQYDTYGGWLRLKGHKTGFFHTEQVGGRWWLVTPEGNVFFAKGVGGLDYGRDSQASPEQLKTLASQLRAWGFNSVQSRAALVPGMPYTLILNLAASTQNDLWLLGIVPDYFSPGFREAVERRASELCPRLATDPWLVGYFTDNEVRWFPDIRSKDTVLETFLKKPHESSGYQRAMAFLKARNHTPDSVTWEDKADFLEVAAAEYGRICRDAIHRHDPNHLILGSRFNERAPIPLSRALGPYFDIISFNTYEHRAPLYKLRELSRVTGKPAMVTEFSFKAMDSGLPNTIGAGEPVATQQDRADLFVEYVEDLARLPTCVGYSWFKYRDQRKEGDGTSSPGGWGGENSNYGLVKQDGAPWTLLTRKMTEVNSRIEALAAQSGQH